jgi:MFS family permease
LVNSQNNASTQSILVCYHASGGTFGTGLKARRKGAYHVSDSERIPRAAALYLAVVQFFFTTTWTVYAIYLPQLLAQAGIAARYAIWILMLDQLVFMAMDVTMGIAADRMAMLLGRIGPMILGVTALSCTAFLLMPQMAALGAAAPAALLAAIVLWTLTSSALRAPPWALLSRYAAVPKLAWMNALALSGIAIGGAIAPYLGVLLRQQDPRFPFALSSITLFAATAGLIWVERWLAREPRVAAPAAPPPGALVSRMSPYLVACLLLAFGFQIHTALNSAPQYLRFTAPSELQYLLPVFWIGFNVAMFPGAALARRVGRLPVIAWAALLGAIGAALSAQASTLDLLIAAQLVAGGAWGCVMMALFSAALAYGRSGREGLALGLIFSVLALATLSRMAVVAAQLPRLADYAAILQWAPALLWLVGSVLVAIILTTSRERRNATQRA